jgi:hypothetical protein
VQSLPPPLLLRRRQRLLRLLCVNVIVSFSASHPSWSHLEVASGDVLCRAGSGAKDGKYKCHGFVSASDADAIELCKLLSRVTNEAFARLRHVTRLLEAKKRAALKKKPDVVARKVTVDFEQPW